jgi:alpha-glucosidase/alpha-D-xyloside xylohydrolase
LPAGDWYDFWTNERLAGGREVTRAVDLETLPLFVRAGAILPLDPVRQFTNQATDEPTTLRVYTGNDGEFRWYEDDGGTLDYLRGDYSWLDLRWNDAGRMLSIERMGEGKLSPAPRKLIVELLPSGEKKSLEFDGTPTKIAF